MFQNSCTTRLSISTNYSSWKCDSLIMSLSIKKNLYQSTQGQSSTLVSKYLFSLDHTLGISDHLGKSKSCGIQPIGYCQLSLTPLWDHLQFAKTPLKIILALCWVPLKTPSLYILFFFIFIHIKVCIGIMNLPFGIIYKGAKYDSKM